MAAWIGKISLALVLASTFTLIVRPQPIQKSDKEILAEREFEEGKRIYNEASLASQSNPWPTTLAGFNSALDRFSKSLVLYREIGMRRNEAFCLAWVGRLSQWIGNDARSIDAYSDAVKIFDKLGDTLEVGRQQANIALIYYGKKDFNNAVAYYTKAVAAARTAKDATLEQLALSSLGQSYAGLFDRTSAIKAWEEAVKVSEGSGDRLNQAFTLKLIASAYNDAGDRQKALSYYERALEIYRKYTGNTSRQLEAYTLRGMADINSVLGDHRKALALDLEALALLRALNAHTNVADSLARIADTYGEMGDKENAIRYQTEAVSIQEAYGTKKQVAEALERLGYLYQYVGDDLPTAKQAIERSLSIAREIKDREVEARALSSLGSVYADLPDGKAKEIEYKRLALDLYIAVGEFEEAGNTLTDLGIAQYFAKDLRGAAENLNLALILYTSFEMPTRLARPLTWLGHTWADAGNPKMATAYAKQALIGYQNLRGNIAGLDQAAQRGYLKGIEDNYRALVNMLLRQRRLKEAHQILVAFKDEQSLDVTDAPDERKQVAITLTARESAFWQEYIRLVKQIIATRRRITAINEAIAKGEATPEQKEERAGLDAEFAQGWKSLAGWSAAQANEFAKPDDAKDVVPDLKENSVIWNALRQVSRATGQETVAIYQFVSRNGVDSLIFTTDEIRHVNVPNTASNERARKLWALLQSDKYDPRPLAKELYDQVFKPLEAKIPAGTKTILWSTDGNFRYIPMAAMFDGKHYLLERFNHVAFTRADGERLTHGVPPNWSASAFGSSKAHAVEVAGSASVFNALPGVSTELNSIFGTRRSSIIGGDVLIDAAFTRAKLLSTLSTRRPIVHIASHFSFRPGDDERSFLLLGDGTAFTLAEMKKQKDMFVGVELLTLSACNTAAQHADSYGREIDSFFELAQRLGARSVLATLWPVADNSTPWLMREFYDLKIRKNENKAEALRDAQLALLNGSARAARSAARADSSPIKIVVVPNGSTRADVRSDEFVIEERDAKPFERDPRRPFAHPFYWSPFILVGNWR